MCDDADYVAVVLGSSFGTMKEAVDQLRAKGKKVGVCMPRIMRPWPAKYLAKVLAGKKAVAVMDKHLSVGAYGQYLTSPACDWNAPSFFFAMVQRLSVEYIYNYLNGGPTTPFILVL